MPNPDCTPTKVCSKCGVEYPLTPEYFHRHKRRKGGFREQCRECRGVKSLPNGISCPKIVHPQCPKGYKFCTAGNDCINKNGPILPATVEYFHLNRRGDSTFSSMCKECRNHKSRQRYNGETSRHDPDYHRNYRKNNPERFKQYRKRHKTSSKIHRINYYTRKDKLPATLSPSDWRHALDYFHGCCAVCGRQLKDLFGEHTAAMDHWIPLSSPDCPGTVPTNIVPLCHGVGGCNNQKGNKNPQQWLEGKFSKRKSDEISRLIQNYFNSLI